MPASVGTIISSTGAFLDFFSFFSFLLFNLASFLACFFSALISFLDFFCCGDAAEDVMPSSYSWDYYVSEDERCGVEGCGAHPLQMQGYRTLKVSGEEAIPIFAQMPDSWEIMCWDKACWGDPKAASEKVEITDKGFIPKEGNWIYAITASWNTPQYGGTAEYVFQIEN